MSVKLSPVFNDQTFDANNVLASGYKLFTYVAGSTTKLTTYTDESGAVPQSNPIILNSLGYPTSGPIWLTAGNEYKFVLALPTDTDPPTSPVKTIDDVTGINDSSTAVSQWVSSGLTPTYISPTSFSLSGDQTSEFHVGRRVQATVAGGTVYGTILTSVFAALTTVTLTMDSPGVLDAGLSVVNLSLLRNDYSAIPALVSSAVQSQAATAYTAGGTDAAYTLTPNPAITANAANQRFRVKFNAAPGAAPTLAISGQAALSLKYYDSNGTKQAITATQVPANWISDVENDGTDYVVLQPVPLAPGTVPVRQTVLSGPVDSGGFSDFGGSTGSTTVTTSGTLIVTAAYGFGAHGAVDYVGSITDPIWTTDAFPLTVTTPIASPGVVNCTGHGYLANEPVIFYGGTLPTGLVANTTYYVRSTGLGANSFQVSAAPGGAAINFTGTSSGTQTAHPQIIYAFMQVEAPVNSLVTGSFSRRHAPIYIKGGTPSVVDGQFTFDTTKAIAYGGNGSSAVQESAVCVGEFAMSSGNVSAITWYDLLAENASVKRTWQDVKASRALATTYYNATGHEVDLAIVTSGIVTTLTVTDPGAAGVAVSSGSPGSTQVFATVSPGGSYSLVGPGATIVVWAERR